MNTHSNSNLHLTDDHPVMYDKEQRSDKTQYLNTEYGQDYNAICDINNNSVMYHILNLTKKIMKVLLHSKLLKEKILFSSLITGLPYI